MSFFYRSIKYFRAFLVIDGWVLNVLSDDQSFVCVERISGKSPYNVSDIFKPLICRWDF